MGGARVSSTGSASATAAARSSRFFDGPVTANKTLAVHTAWGRTLKDVFQRYKALRGFDQRYQNGFDCQGLWIEVGVERELGLNSKREIEEYGLDKFARKCRDVVVWSARGADARARSGSACGWTGATTTSRSATRTSSTSGASSRPSTRAAGSTWGTARPSGARAAARRSPSTSCRVGRLPGAARSVALRPAAAPRPARRVARDLDDDAVDAAGERRRRGQSRRRVRPARRTANGSRSRAIRTRRSRSGCAGGARRLALRGPFDTLAPGAAVEHRVIPWDEVTLDDGTGIVHIAPGCGGEDFELAQACTTCRC